VAVPAGRSGEACRRCGVSAGLRETTALAEPDEQKRAGKRRKKGRFYAATAIDFRMCIDMRLRRAASAFAGGGLEWPEARRPRKARLLDSCPLAADLRKAVRRPSHVTGREASQLLDAPEWASNPFWHDAKGLLAAAVRREPAARLAGLLTRANTGAPARERIPLLWWDWYRMWLAERHKELLDERTSAEETFRDEERRRDPLMNGGPRSEVPAPAGPAEAMRAAAESCRRVVLALGGSGVADAGVYQRRVDALWGEWARRLPGLTPPAKPNIGNAAEAVGAIEGLSRELPQDGSLTRESAAEGGSPHARADGPIGFNAFRVGRWTFTDLTPVGMRLLTCLWERGAARGGEGYVEARVVAEAVYGISRVEFAEKQDAARKRLSRTLVEQSDGAVSVSSRRDPDRRLHYRLDVNPPPGTKGGQQQ
jgi:hypothetical protein